MFDAVAEAHVNLKEVAAEERAGWSSLAHSDRVRDVFSIAERAEAELIRTVMGWNRAGGWEADGQRSAVCWLVWQNQIARPRAKVLVDSAELCARYPDIAAALAGGEIACGHVAAMARVEHPHPDEFATCAEGLLGAAADTSVVEFDWVAKQWANAVDHRAPADDRDRGLAISDTFGGKSYVKGSGSTEEAAILRKALAKDNPPDPADRPEGPRTLSQRMWDRLIDLARRELAGADPTGPADGLDLVADAETVARSLAQQEGVDPQLDLDLDLDPDPDDQPTAPESSGDSLGAVLARYCDRPTDANTGTQTGTDAAPPAPATAPAPTVPWCGVMGGPPLPPSVVARWLCTAWVRRVIRDPRTGHVMDYGRRQRLYNTNQRRAMAHRDGGCGFPGCDLGPRYCDAHHLRPWTEGGLTNIDWGLLLCRRHHVLVHDKGWTLGRDPTTGIVTATSPDGRTFTRRPNPLTRRV